MQMVYYMSTLLSSILGISISLNVLFPNNKLDSVLNVFLTLLFTFLFVRYIFFVKMVKTTLSETIIMIALFSFISYIILNYLIYYTLIVNRERLVKYLQSKNKKIFKFLILFLENISNKEEYSSKLKG